MAVTNLFYSFATYNMRVFQVADVKGEYNDSEYVISRVLTCVLAFLLCVIFVFIAEYTAMQRIIVLCYMVFRANEAFIDVLHAIDQKQWRMDYIGISHIARGISMLAAFTLLGRSFGLLPAIIGMAIVTLLIGLLFDIPKAKKLAQFTAYAGRQVFSLLKRCFPLMLVILIITLIATFTRYSVERIHGNDALGVYASVTAPVLIVQLAVSLLFAPLANLFAESIKELDKKKFIKIFLIASAIIIAIVLVFFSASLIFGEWGLNLLYGESILPYVYLLPGAAIVIGLGSYVFFMNLVYGATRDIKGIFFGNLTGAVICLATTDLFLLRYGLIGANYVMILSQSVAIIVLLARLLLFINKKPGLFVQEC